MSAPLLLATAAAAVCLGLPVVAASLQLEARHVAAGAADAGALAAADAAAGWIDGDPCALASAAVRGAGAELVSCRVEADGRASRVRAREGEPFAVEAVARAGSPPGAAGGPGAAVSGPVGASGWAWPSDRRGVTQGFHDGLAIDLRVSASGALFAPFDGVVVVAGPDGAGVPAACRASPFWWHGPNHTVLIRHETGGRVLFSSHNHIAPGSPERLGVAPGARVRAGQQVAEAGMSGCTSGPHTHFTLATTASNAFPDVDPFAYLGEP